jgi:hypothetical protein
MTTYVKLKVTLRTTTTIKEAFLKLFFVSLRREIGTICLFTTISVLFAQMNTNKAKRLSYSLVIMIIIQIVSSYGYKAP